jgi:hypothetical protein
MRPHGKLQVNLSWLSVFGGIMSICDPRDIYPNGVPPQIKVGDTTIHNCGKARKFCNCGIPLCNEAIDRIEQLERELAAMREDAKVMCSCLAAAHDDNWGTMPDEDLAPLLEAIGRPIDFDAEQQVMRRIFGLPGKEG